MRATPSTSSFGQDEEEGHQEEWNHKGPYGLAHDDSSESKGQNRDGGAKEMMLLPSPTARGFWIRPSLLLRACNTPRTGFVPGEAQRKSLSRTDNTIAILVTVKCSEDKRQSDCPFDGALCPSKSGLMKKHIVKHIVRRVRYRVAYDWMRV